LEEHKEKNLTPKERLFVVEYLNDLNANQAAIRAGYSKKTARYIGYENLTKPHIQTALSEARNTIEKREEAALLTAEEVERKLDALINQNPQNYYNKDGTLRNVHDLTPEQAYAISEVTRIETEIGSHLKLKFESKLAAIEKKMKRLGMFKDSVDPSCDIETFEDRLKRLGLDE
jgi:phage terminase small subunit